MGCNNYKIAPPKGSANYDCWSKDIWEIRALDYYWLTSVGKKIELTISQLFPEEKTASMRDDRTSVKAVMNKELTKDIYEAKIKKYKDKLLNYYDKYIFSSICNNTMEW